MTLALKRESFDNAASWLASEQGKRVKTGGITLSYANKAADPVTGKRIYKSGEFVGLLSNQGNLAELFGTYGTGRRACLQTALAGVNNDVLWTARAVGTGGNAITVAYVDPGGNNQPLTVGVVGNAVTVNLATGPAGAITSTALQIIAAVRASAAADALVFGEIPPHNTGHGVVIALAPTALAGGVSPVCQAASLTTGVIGGVANTSVVYTAKTAGANGNNIQVRYVVSGFNTPLSVDIVGDGTAANPYIVTVHLATNGTPAALTTGLIDAVADTSAVYTAKTPGASGNNIQIAYDVPAGAGVALSCAVTGTGTVADPYIITVTTATAGAGVATSTLAEIIAAINNHPIAGLLVSGAPVGAGAGVPLVDYVAAPLIGGAGGTATSTIANIIAAINSHWISGNLILAEAAGLDTGVPLVNYGPTTLANGADPDVSLAAGEFGLLVQDVDVTDGNEIGGLLYGGKVLSARLPSAPDDTVTAALPHVMFIKENGF